MRLHQSVKIITLPLQLKTLLTEILWSWRWQFSPHAPLGLPSFEETIIFMATVDNYELLFAKEDPNKPIQPEIPGLCEELIPWCKDLEWADFRNGYPHTTCLVRAFCGNREAVSLGWSYYQQFSDKWRAPEVTRPVRNTEWKDNYKRKGPTLAVRSDFVTARG